MELHKAIKEIISLKGKDIIANAQIINFLLDYQAFKDFPAAKMVLRDIIGMGYPEKILSLDSNSLGWRTKWNQYIHEFTESCGYKEDLVFHVFNSIAFGIGIAPNLQLQEQSSTESEEFTNGIDALVGKIAGLKLPSGDVMAVKVERLDEKTAGIRTKGWNRYRVPASLIVSSDEKRPTLPDWFKEGIILSDGRTIVSIDRYYTLLSDGKFYKHIDILLNCSPMLIQNTEEHE